MSDVDGVGFSVCKGNVAPIRDIVNENVLKLLASCECRFADCGKLGRGNVDVFDVVAILECFSTDYVCVLNLYVLDRLRNGGVLRVVLACEDVTEGCIEFCICIRTCEGKGDGFKRVTLVECAKTDFLCVVGNVCVGKRGASGECEVAYLGNASVRGDNASLASDDERIRIRFDDAVSRTVIYGVVLVDGNAYEVFAGA